jgi:serine/threonine protein kinase
MASGVVGGAGGGAAAAAPSDVVEPERKFHRVTVNREVMEVDVRYSQLKFIGGGAYGFVCAAEDSVRGRLARMLLPRRARRRSNAPARDSVLNAPSSSPSSPAHPLPPPSHRHSCGGGERRGLCLRAWAPAAEAFYWSAPLGRIRAWRDSGPLAGGRARSLFAWWGVGTAARTRERSQVARHLGAQVTGKRVAIKKIKDVFRDLTDAKRILREIKLLRHLGGHQNIIWILDIMVSPNRRDFVYV